MNDHQALFDEDSALIKEWEDLYSKKTKIERRMKEIMDRRWEIERITKRYGTSPKENL
jgi:hypothetical protein